MPAVGKGQFREHPRGCLCSARWVPAFSRLSCALLLNQSILECSEAPPASLFDGDQGLDGMLFWRRESLARKLGSAVQMKQGDVFTQEADALDRSLEMAASIECLKDLLVPSGNGLAPLEVYAIPDNIIGIFCEGGSVGLPVSLIPPIY